MGCGTTLMKYLLIFFDLIFMFGGLALVVLGAIFHFKSDLITSLHLKNTFIPSIFLISIGIIIFVIAFLGCCGVIKESSCVLMTFSTILTIIFLVQLIAGILAIVYQSHIDEFVVKKMHDAINSYEKNSTSKDIVDDWQKSLHCCGVNGSSDWKNITTEVPDSCKCKNSENHCHEGVYNVGCLAALKTEIRTSGVILGGIAIGLAFIELVSIIFSCAYAASMRHFNDRPILDFTSYYDYN